MAEFGRRRAIDLLTHLRWASAALVAIGHCRNLLMVDFTGGGVGAKAFYFATGFGPVAVVTFFVLSGFLVGQKVRELYREPEPDFGGYVLDRFSRIGAVLFPALALSAVVAVIIATTKPSSPIEALGHWSAALTQPLASDANPWRWLATATFTNGIFSQAPVINGPLWSLACEWSYYIIAAGAVAVLRRRWSWLALYAGALLVLAGFRDLELLVGGIVWTLGLLASIVSDRRLLRGRLLLVACSVVGVGALVLGRLHAGLEIVSGLGVALAISHAGWRDLKFATEPGERLASFSYSLYSIHFPVAVLIAALVGARGPFGAPSVLLVVVAFGAAVCIARPFARLTEARTAQLRRLTVRAISWARIEPRPRPQLPTGL